VRVLRNEILRQVGFAGSVTPTLNGCITGLPNGAGIGYKKSPSSLRVMETVQGNHIGYNTVEVTKTGNGKTKYQYYGSDIWDQNQTDVCIRNVSNTTCNIALPNWPDAPLPFEFMRGELKYEAYFNQANNLLKDIFYYPLFVNSIATTPACIFKSGALTFYNLTTAKKTKMTVVANEYPLTGGTVTNIDSIFYESPYHQQQTRKVSINSKGVKTESKTKYAFDFRVPNCEAISDCWQAYATAYSNALNNYNLATNTCSNAGSCNCKWTVFQSYRYYWSVARKNYITCRRSSFMNATNSFKTAHDNARTGADTELRPILILQDKFINSPIETTSWKNGNLIAASYIKYDSTFAPEPFGNAYPSKQQEIKLAAPSATFTQAVSNNTTITKDTRYKDEATIKFAGGNVSELQKKDGITYSFIWDYPKNFTTAIATAAASAEIAYTSFESNGTGSFTYTTYKTADITAPTGNYCYPIASGSIQKTNLISTKSYFLSYWWKTGATISVTAGTQSNIITGYTRNGWSYRQLQFTGTVSAIISGTGFIDEIRIYPVGSQVNTYTYTPLVGLTSQTDPNGKASYFEYDKLGRLKNIKDKLKNITKTFFYNYGLTPTTPPALISLNASNASSTAGSIVLTSKTTGQVFNFLKLPGSTTIIGNVPPDVYDINVSLGIQRYIQICSYGSYTSNFTAYNVQVDGLACNSITIY
jgi:YD repeat-containing protein